MNHMLSKFVFIKKDDDDIWQYDKWYIFTMYSTQATCLSLSECAVHVPRPNPEHKAYAREVLEQAVLRRGEAYSCLFSVGSGS